MATPFSIEGARGGSRLRLPFGRSGTSVCMSLRGKTTVHRGAPNDAGDRSAVALLSGDSADASSAS